MPDSATLLFAMQGLREDVARATSRLDGLATLEQREQLASAWRKDVDERLEDIADRLGSIDALGARLDAHENHACAERDAIRRALAEVDVPAMQPATLPPIAAGPSVSLLDAANAAGVRLIESRFGATAVAIVASFFIGVWTLIIAAWLDVPAHKVRAFLPGALDVMAADDDDGDDGDDDGREERD